MPRVQPRDDTYPATLAKAFAGTNSGQDADLTQQFTEQPHAAAEVIVTNNDAAMQALIVKLQGDSVNLVSFFIAPATTMWIRGAFTLYSSTNNANIRATFLWQGGAS